MKIRTCYVSNSSSSSYVCDICGHAESGWDESPSDLGMCECVNGHVFCEGHELETPPLTIGELREHVQDWQKKGVEKYYPEAVQFIGLLPSLAAEYIVEHHYLYNDDVERFVKDAFDDKVREESCPICMFKKLSTYDGFAFLKKLHGLTDEAILEDFRKRFKNYEEFERFLHGNTNSSLY